MILSGDALKLRGHRPLAKDSWPVEVVLCSEQSKFLSTCYHFKIFLIMIYSFILLGGAKLAKREQEAVSIRFVLCSLT